MALRTLRQLPKVVDETSDGDPVYEVGSVRLVLPGESNAFNRLVECSRCRREIVGAAVLGPDDLNRAPLPMVCRACVTASGVSGWRSDQRRAVAAPAPPSSPAPARPAAAEMADARPEEVDRGRLHVLEERLEAIATRLAAAEAPEEPADDDELSGRLGELASSLEAQRIELRSAVELVSGLRPEIERVTEAHKQLARGQQELDRRLAGIAARPVSAPPEASAVDALRRRVDEVEVELRELRALLEQGLDQVRSEAASHEQLVEQALSRLSATLSTLHSDVESSVNAAVRFEIATVVQAQQELSAGQRSVERKLDGLSSALDAQKSRLHDMERGLQVALDQVQELLHRRAAPAPPLGSVVGSLLEDLNAQLDAAERRLSERASAEQVHAVVERRDRPATTPVRPSEPAETGDDREAVTG